MESSPWSSLVSVFSITHFILLFLNHFRPTLQPVLDIATDIHLCTTKNVCSYNDDDDDNDDKEDDGVDGNDDNGDGNDDDNANDTLFYEGKTLINLWPSKLNTTTDLEQGKA